MCVGSRHNGNLLTTQVGLWPVRTADAAKNWPMIVLNIVKQQVRGLLIPGEGDFMRKRIKTKSLVQQVKETLDAQLAIGCSKRADRLNGCQESRIYSWETYRVYLRHSCAFAKWAKERHGVRVLADARQYAEEYVRELTAAGYAPSTLKLIASAIAKTYSCSTDDLKVVTAPRRRADITRSRGHKKSDAHFSEKNNQDLVEFCRATGLRNHKELQQICGDQLEYRDGYYYIVGVKGKGGKIRDVPVLPDYEATVVRCCVAAGSGKVWPHVSSHADIHSYRADYASAWYKRLARPAAFIPPVDRYVCRRDRAGVVYDKAAMLQVSRMLGHNRISVIAGHYLHD